MAAFFRVFPLLALLLGVSVQATTLVALDVVALTKNSSMVARARVVSSAARWTQDQARIITDTKLEVVEVWKGAPRSDVVVMQPGGVVGEIGQKVHGTAQFSAGEEVVVFLEARGDRFVLTGMVQGKFVIERSSDGKAQVAKQAVEGDARLIDPQTRKAVEASGLVMPLEKLRSQVLSASGAQAPVESGHVGTGTIQVTP